MVGVYTYTYVNYRRVFFAIFDWSLCLVERIVVTISVGHFGFMMVLSSKDVQLSFTISATADYTIIDTLCIYLFI